VSDVTRADYCTIGVAECFRGDGEIMANPIGTIPAIGGRLARDVFEPDLVMTDGEALLVSNGIPVGVDAPDKTIEAWNPYRTMFDVVWSGRRHVMMGASQLDPYGNHNTAVIYNNPEFQALAGQELDVVHDQIFNHPNFGPFLCRQLIQRLVTSRQSKRHHFDSRWGTRWRSRPPRASGWGASSRRARSTLASRPLYSRSGGFSLAFSSMQRSSRPSDLPRSELLARIFRCSPCSVLSA